MDKVIDTLKKAIEDWTVIDRSDTVMGLCLYFRLNLNKTFVNLYLLPFSPKHGLSTGYWYPLTEEGDKERLALLKKALVHYQQLYSA